VHQRRKKWTGLRSDIQLGMEAWRMEFTRGWGAKTKWGYAKYVRTLGRIWVHGRTSAAKHELQKHPTELRHAVTDRKRRRDGGTGGTQGRWDKNVRRVSIATEKASKTTYPRKERKGWPARVLVAGGDDRQTKVNAQGETRLRERPCGDRCSQEKMGCANES